MTRKLWMISIFLWIFPQFCAYSNALDSVFSTDFAPDQYVAMDTSSIASSRVLRSSQSPPAASKASSTSYPQNISTVPEDMLLSRGESTAYPPQSSENNRADLPVETLDERIRLTDEWVVNPAASRVLPEQPMEQPTAPLRAVVRQPQSMDKMIASPSPRVQPAARVQVSSAYIRDVRNDKAIVSMPPTPGYWNVPDKSIESVPPAQAAQQVAPANPVSISQAQRVSLRSAQPMKVSWAQRPITSALASPAQHPQIRQAQPIPTQAVQVAQTPENSTWAAPATPAPVLAATRVAVAPPEEVRVAEVPTFPSQSAIVLSRPMMPIAPRSEIVVPAQPIPGGKPLVVAAASPVGNMPLAAPTSTIIQVVPASEYALESDTPVRAATHVASHQQTLVPQQAMFSAPAYAAPTSIQPRRQVASSSSSFQSRASSSSAPKPVGKTQNATPDPSWHSPFYYQAQLEQAYRAKFAQTDQSFIQAGQQTEAYTGLKRQLFSDYAQHLALDVKEATAR